MRILFLAGFGEDVTIFDKIAHWIPGEKVFLSSWDFLGDVPRPDTHALKVAKELVGRYQISTQDLLIGHSTGGWIAYHIKHLTHCPIVQIASWTSPDQVILPVSNPELMFWAIKKGLYFNALVEWLIITLKYRNKPSKEIFRSVFKRMRAGNKNNLINQLRVILTPVEENITGKPDLRIHARGDTIIKPPVEPYQEVSGDHFTLYTHPQEVYLPILAFLKETAASI